jgi:hypothetical protein
LNKSKYLYIFLGIALSEGQNDAELLLVMKRMQLLKVQTGLQKKKDKVEE